MQISSKLALPFFREDNFKAQLIASYKNDLQDFLKGKERIVFKKMINPKGFQCQLKPLSTLKGFSKRARKRTASPLTARHASRDGTLGSRRSPKGGLLCPRIIGSHQVLVQQEKVRGTLTASINSLDFKTNASPASLFK
jgi:hypothetical protein